MPLLSQVGALQGTAADELISVSLGPRVFGIVDFYNCCNGVVLNGGIVLRLENIFN